MKTPLTRLFKVFSLLFAAQVSMSYGQIIDTDNDRMADGYETTHGLVIGTDDRYGDADGDGYPNLSEYLKSTLASDAASVPTADRIVGAGQTYTTISAAVTSLSADDQIIVVKPGTYTEVINNATASAKRVFIISEAVDPNLTFIRNPSTAAATVSSTKDLFLRGFTLVNQWSTTAVTNHGVSLTGTGYYGIVQCIMRGHYNGIFSSASTTARNFVDVVGCLIQDGSAYGIYTQSNASTFRVVHTTISGHSALAVYNFASGSVFSYTNSILWGTAATQMGSGYTPTITATYTCIKNPTVYTGTGNINTDPQLVQGYLSASSPCINVATATTVPLVPEDVRGDPRVNGAAPDMGAHEYSTAGSWTGDTDADGLSDATELYTYGSFIYSNDTDADRIADGYEIAQGLSILVDDRYGDADGDGFPNLAEALKGSQAGNASVVPTADRIVGVGQTYTTISAALASLTLDDQIIVVKPGTYTEAVNNTTASAKRVFIISEEVDPNVTSIRNPSPSVAVVSSTKDLYLRGFTLINQSPIISAYNYGLHISGAGYYGVVQCIIRGQRWGIMNNSPGTARTFVDVIGCLIQDCSSNGIYTINNPSTFRLVHTTIIGSALSAIYNSASSSVFSYTNCILWGSAATQITSDYSQTVTAAYSCIKNPTVYAGTGNINTDPQLVQGYLSATSPCINAATATTVPLVPEDMRGDPRVSGAAPDMGAHEYSTAGSWTGDLDGDGYTDAAELYTHGTQFYSNDTDGDRMLDSYEIVHGLKNVIDDRYGDADGDGFPNLIEALKGSQASNASNIPTPDRLVGKEETYTTISAALASLTTDDQLIVVRPGVYQESINNSPADPNMARRFFLISETNDPKTTFIRAAPGSAGAVRSSKDLYLAGFMINAILQQDGICYTATSNQAIVNCILEGHRDGVSISSSTVPGNLVLINTLINEAGRYGMYFQGASKVRLIHTTIVGHGMSSTTEIGRGIYGVSTTVIEIYNSILWNGGSAQVQFSANNLLASKSVFRQATPPAGNGNTVADPLLIQGQPDIGSSAINLGGAIPFPVVKDIALKPRIFGGLADAGCYEYQQTVPSGPPTALDLARVNVSAGTGDFDGDGVLDFEELARGTDRFIADTDGDGVSDALDLYPLDPFASGTASGTDTVPPVISIAQPSGALKL